MKPSQWPGELLTEVPVDGLDVCVLLESVRAKLAAEAGLLLPAERRVIEERLVEVHPDRACFKLG
jgi:hypothetical protein